jgi:hypothetical protein
MTVWAKRKCILYTNMSEYKAKRQKCKATTLYRNKCKRTTVTRCRDGHDDFGQGRKPSRATLKCRQRRAVFAHLENCTVIAFLVCFWIFRILSDGDGDAPLSRLKISIGVIIGKQQPIGSRR